MKQSCYLLLIGCLWLVPPCLSEENSCSVLEKVTKWTQSWERIEFDFDQESVNQSIGVKQQAQGIVYVKKPWIKWEYQSPEAYAIYTNGDRVWMVMPSDKQVFTESLQGMELERIPVLFIKDTKPLLTTYSCSKTQVNDSGTTELELLSRSATAQASKVNLRILSSGAVDKVSLHMTDGSTNTFIFNCFRGKNADEEKIAPVEVPDDYMILNFNGDSISRDLLVPLFEFNGMR